MPSRTSGKSLIVAVAMISLLGLVGWVAYINLKSAPEPPVPGPVDPDPPPPVEDEPAVVEHYVPAFEDGELVFEMTEGEVPEGDDPRVYAVNLYLRALDAVPIEAQALTCTVADGVATLNFNAEFERTYGTEDEMILYNGLLKTMGQFDDVSSVVFLAAGEQIDTLGNQDLTGSHPVIR